MFYLAVEVTLTLEEQKLLLFRCDGCGPEGIGLILTDHDGEVGVLHKDLLSFLLEFIPLLFVEDPRAEICLHVLEGALPSMAFHDRGKGPFRIGLYLGCKLLRHHGPENADVVLRKGSKGPEGHVGGHLYFVLAEVDDDLAGCDGFDDTEPVRRLLVNEGSVIEGDICLEGIHGLHEV